MYRIQEKTVLGGEDKTVFSMSQFQYQSIPNPRPLPPNECIFAYTPSFCLNYMLLYATVCPHIFLQGTFLSTIALRPSPALLSAMIYYLSDISKQCLMKMNSFLPIRDMLC